MGIRYLKYSALLVKGRKGRKTTEVVLSIYKSIKEKRQVKLA
jgi:hypothetical protein